MRLETEGSADRKEGADVVGNYGSADRKEGADVVGNYGSADRKDGANLGRKKKPGERSQDRKTKELVFTAMLFAAAIVLSVVESSLPAFVPVPGVKLGLSNIVVMYALFFLGRDKAIQIAVLKGLFTAFTRGATAGILSLSGGLSSILVMALIEGLARGKSTRYIQSVIGAVFHNLGQFAAITFLYGNFTFLYYLPVLLVSGLIAGWITSTLLRVLLPAFQRFSFYKEKEK